MRTMRIAVAGATGNIGARTVAVLEQSGHEVVRVSRTNHLRRVARKAAIASPRPSAGTGFSADHRECRNSRTCACPAGQGLFPPWCAPRVIAGRGAGERPASPLRPGGTGQGKAGRVNASESVPVRKGVRRTGAPLCCWRPSFPGRSGGSPTTSGRGAGSDDQNANHPPLSDEDARSRVQREIFARQGQSDFRESLIRAYRVRRDRVHRDPGP